MVGGTDNVIIPFGFCQYLLEVKTESRSHTVVLEVAAVDSIDELLEKARNTWIVSAYGAIAIGQQIPDSFCETLVSNKPPDLVHFITISRIRIRPRRDGLISPTLCSRRVDPLGGSAVPMVGTPGRLP